MGCRESKMPPQGYALLANDTNILVENNVRMQLVFRHFQTPHQRANYLCLTSVGSWALSDQRIVVYVRERQGRGTRRQVHVVWGDCTAKRAVQFHTSNDQQQDTLYVTVSDLSVLHGDGYRGSLELVVRTHLPESVWWPRIDNAARSHDTRIPSMECN